MEDQSSPVSYIPPRTSLPTGQKNVGKEGGVGKGTSLAGRAQTILCCSLNQVILLHPPQLLCPSPSTASYHHHPAKHYCSPPLIPGPRRAKNHVPQKLRQPGQSSPLLVFNHSPTKIYVGKHYLGQTKGKKKVRKIFQNEEKLQPIP